MQAIPSALNVIHCLLPVHHSLPFPMKSYTSFRVQLKCHQLHVVHLKIALTPFRAGMVHCPLLGLHFVYCIASQLSFRHLTTTDPPSFQGQCLSISCCFHGAFDSQWNLSFFLDVLVTQSCLTFCSTVDYSPPGSSVHEIHQVKITGAISFSRGSSLPRDQTRLPALQADSLPSEPPRKSHFLDTKT